jgi:hypothetical protein
MSGARGTHALMSGLLAVVFALMCAGCGGSAPHITAFADARPRPGEARCIRLVTTKLGHPDGPVVAHDACRKRFGWYYAQVTNPASKSVWFHCTVAANSPVFGELGVWTVPFNNQLDAPTKLGGGTTTALTWFTPETSSVAAQTVSYKLNCKTTAPP